MAQSEELEPRAGGPIEGLTNRQRACLRRVAEGRTSKEIAREFGISPSTVDNHITTAMRLVGCTNRLEAARLIQGQLPPPEPAAELPSELTALPVETLLRLPPLGGRPNRGSATRRLLLVMQVLLLGLMVGIGAIVSILGVVRLLSP